MILHIVDEIRRMRQDYYRKYGHRGKVICLDANTEARVAAYMIFELSQNDGCFLHWPDSSIDDILKNGIRHFGLKIFGMKLKFDCPSFYIEPNILFLHPLDYEV